MNKNEWVLKFYIVTDSKKKTKPSPITKKVIANNIEDAIELAKIEMIKGYYPSCWDKLKQREKTWIKQTVEGEIVKRKDKKGETYFTIKNKLYLTEKTVKKKSKRGRD